MKPYLDKLRNLSHKFKQQTYMLYLAYKNPATPWFAKVFAGLVIAYAFSPIDLIPDFIPVIGYLDDLILVPLGIWLALRMIPDSVIKEAREQASIEIMQSKPPSWIAVTIIILIWLGLAALMIYWIYRIIGK